MIEMKFYRDDEYVYINNPDGTTNRVAIKDFESAISGKGGDIPDYSSSNEGESLSVNSNGGLEWTSLIFPIHQTQTGGLDKTWNEIKSAALSGKSCVFIDDHEPANITLNPIYSISIDADSGAYKIICAYWIEGNSFGSAVFSSATADGYPQPD